MTVAARVQAWPNHVSTLLSDAHVEEHLSPTKLKGRKEPIDVYRLRHTEESEM